MFLVLLGIIAKGDDARPGRASQPRTCADRSVYPGIAVKGQVFMCTGAANREHIRGGRGA